ncbi:hypothetical protein OAA63_03845 [Candidatus Pelagibacter ubique]|nr:hypothetical protein [Candidatus Pelagibacter ubique]
MANLIFSQFSTIPTKKLFDLNKKDKSRIGDNIKKKLNLILLLIDLCISI